MFDFRERRVVFAPNARIQRRREKVDFGRAVNKANAALKGYNIGYADDLDRDMARIIVNIEDVDVEGNEVHFTVATIFRDASNNDRFEAEVFVLVVADVADVV